MTAISAIGRKRTLISVVLVVPERPLSGKAVIERAALMSRG